MPQRGHKHKIAFIGDLTLANSLDWCVAACIGVWLSLVLFQIGGSRPDTMVFSMGFLGVALLLQILCILADSERDPFTLNFWGLLFFPAIIYVALNLYLWSPYPWRGVEELLNMLQAVVIYWIAVQNFRTRSHVWFILMVLVGMASYAVLLCIMQFFHNPSWLPPILDPRTFSIYPIHLPEQYQGRATGFFGAPTSFAGFLLLVGFPLLVAGLSRRLPGIMRLFCVYAAGMMIGAIFLSMSRGAIMLALAGAVLAPFLARVKLKYVLFVWLGGGLALASVFFLMFAFNDEFRARIDTAIEIGGESSRPVMWAAAWKQFLDAPVLGNGVGAYDYLFEDYRPEGFNRTPSHAHNDYLETLADQGLIGFLLLWGPVGAIAFFTIREWYHQPSLVRLTSNDGQKSLGMPAPKFIIGVVGLGVLLFCGHMMLEFHLRTPGLAMVFFLLLGLLVKCIPGPRINIRQSTALRSGIMLVGLILALAIPLWAIPQYLALVYVEDGRRMMENFTRKMDELKGDEAYFAAMLDTLREGARRAPDNAEVWSDLSNAVAAQDFLHPGQSRQFGEEAEPFARQSIQITTKQPLAWIHLGNALSLQGRMVEAGEVYRKATEIAPNRADVWYYYAEHLMLLKSTRPQALEAVERALELQPGNERAIKLRRKILIP